MLSRFQGCLVGAVVADCIGAKFEGEKHVKIEEAHEEVKKLERNRKEQREKGTRPADVYCYRYTDDTAMARSVADSLLIKNAFDASDMAERFQKEYFSDPNRGYGGNIGSVFAELRDVKDEDVYKPASKQFDGSGSYGNGGAMRIAPAALFAYFDDNDSSKLLSLVSSITRLTHTHPWAIMGAQLEALAVDQCLRWKQGQEVNAGQFIDALTTKLRPMEEEVGADQAPLAKNMRFHRELDRDPTPYCAKLNRIVELLKCEHVKTKDVVHELGNDVSAIGSVPAAVLAFLYAATKGIPELQGRSRFEQTVIYAISLGGDTDTIATMAAAMAGALYGIEQIPEAWQYYCEGVADADKMAEKFYSRGGASQSTT